MKNRLSILLLLILAAVAVSAQDLRESVCIVEAEYTPAEKSQMSDLALWFSRKGFTSASRELSAYKNGTSGSGAVIESGSSRYILTNRHVVGYASAAKVSFVLRDTTLVYEHCAVKTVSHNEDLALVCLPASCTQPAMAISMVAAEDGQDIVAAGFPGLAGKPSWQITKGSVSNANLHIDKEKSVYIQHTAPIDPGSSGGPLLQKQGDTYLIVGINTLKAFWRDNVGLAIPADAISRFITTASSSEPAASELAAITINGETWATMVDKMDKECADSLRNMIVDMPLDVVTNTLALDCAPEVKPINSKRSDSSSESSSSAESKRSKRTSKIVANDLGNYFTVRVKYENMLSKNQQIELKYEVARQWYVTGLQVLVGFEELDNEMPTNFGVGITLGAQLPLNMGKNYAIPRLLAEPYVQPVSLATLSESSSLPKQLAGLPLSIGCDFAFPIGDYLLSVGVHYLYAFNFYHSVYDESALMLTSNRKLLLNNSATSIVGQNGLGVSFAFWW